MLNRHRLQIGQHGRSAGAVDTSTLRPSAAAEIRVRAEHRAGEMLAEMEKLKGRPAKGSPDVTLSDLGPQCVPPKPNADHPPTCRHPSPGLSQLQQPVCSETQRMTKPFKHSPETVAFLKTHIPDMIAQGQTIAEAIKGLGVTPKM